MLVGRVGRGSRWLGGLVAAAIVALVTVVGCTMTNGPTALDLQRNARADCQKACNDTAFASREQCARDHEAARELCMELPEAEQGECLREAAADREACNQAATAAM